MTKPWSERPLWERVWLGPQSTLYLNAGKIIGHLGVTAPAFDEAAQVLPGYDKYRYENAARDLTVYALREQGRYELHPSARKILRVILGPAPGDPEYVTWWRLRLISVEQMKRDGIPVNWVESPPVPLPEEAPAAGEPEPQKKPSRKESKKPARPRKKNAG